MMNIAGLGLLRKNEKYGWYVSDPVPLALLNGQHCRVVLEGYDDDAQHEHFHVAASNLLNCQYSVLLGASQHVFDYCMDINALRESGDPEYVDVKVPSDIWAHVQFGEDIYLSRNDYLDTAIYASLECNCNWEIEHGLQIVLKNGAEVTKVGPYDGHATNARAYDAPELVDVVYKRI